MDSHSFFARALIAIAAQVLAARNAAQSPQTGKADDRVNESAHPRGVAIEQPRDEVKLEKTPEAPIQRSDDH